VNEVQKKSYLEKYYKAKAKGVKFWPNVIYEDLLVTFAVFIILIMLATFVGVANEPKADPSDSAYIPRPEWYFLFLFQMLKYFPGSLEWIGTFILPVIAVGVLFLLPFLDRNPNRHFSKRKLAIGIMSAIVVGIIALTILAAATTPPQTEAGTAATKISDQILAGQDLYSVQCVECHGAEGEGGEVKGVEGLEGYMMKPINTQDEMYTRTDETLFNIIQYGQPSLGMTPFGKAFSGELGPGDIDAIVTFMRYTWDDRAEIPAEVAQASALPALAPDQVPSYEVHVAPLVKRYCASCHRAGKKNNNYLMGSYDEVMNSGDNAPNVKPGDLSCNMIRMLNRDEIDAGGPMPPTKALKPEVLDIFTRWVASGAPNTAADAQALAPVAVPTSGAVITSTVTVSSTLPITSTLPAPAPTAYPGISVSPTP
jgi:menaquinol-cytochrome c reductase cytochrome b/c subunit